MLAVAAAGLLAVAGVAAHDTSLRLPGTPLRFGTSLAQVEHELRMHAAPQATWSPPPPATRGAIAWHTGLRFFGLEGTATLEFKDSVLVRAAVVVDHPSPHDIDYVEDDLARRGFRRRCEQRDGLSRRCEWTGRARVRLTTSAARLEASVEPLEPPAGPAPEAARAPGPGAAGAEPAVPAPPETLSLNLPRAAGAPGIPDTLPSPVVLDSCLAIRPEIARQSGVFGSAIVEVTVDAGGQVVASRVSKGVPMLDEAALACARRYRFAPLLWRGRTHPFRVALWIRTTP